MQTTELKRMSPEEEAKVGELFLKHKDRVRTLEEARAVANEIGLSGQVELYDREIKTVSKRWKIDHQNPYQECTKEEAHRAFCEPTNACAKHSTPDCSGCRLRELPFTEKFKWELWTDNVHVTRPEPKVTVSVDPALPTLGNLQQAVSQTQNLANQFYTYTTSTSFDYASMYNQLGNQMAGRLGGFQQTRQADPILYPMGALLNLKEAIGKDLFDTFECWRPVTREEKRRLEDPWLVGVVFDNSKTRYFKIADWK